MTDSGVNEVLRRHGSRKSCGGGGGMVPAVRLMAVSLIQEELP